MKTNRILLSLTSLFIACIVINAQECYTPASTPPAWIFNAALRSTQATPSSYTIRVFFHIVRSSSGSGLGSDIASVMLSRLNSDYASTGIQFQSSGCDFINDNTFYNDLSESEFPLLFSVNSHNNAIDIYVLGTSTTGMASGIAANIPATAYIVHGTRYNTTTLSHEMGHCLGLYHTHHGTVTEGGGDANQCKELVNGSNAATCGDYITDTPADPDLWSGCTYAGGSRVDANQQLYHPNPANYMAYSNPTCRNLFTPLQIQRMKDFIANTVILQNVIANAGPTLSGPSSVCPCSSGTFILQNLPSGSSITWTVGNWLQIQGSANQESVNVKNRLLLPPFTSESPDSWIKAEIYIANQLVYTVQKNITINTVALSSIETPSTIKAGQVYFFTCNHNSSAWPTWTVSPNTGFNMNLWSAAQLEIGFGITGNFMITVSATNLCGTSTINKPITVTGNIQPPCSGCSIQLPNLHSISYPNPADNILNIEIDENAVMQTKSLDEQTAIGSKIIRQNAAYDIRLYDGLGNLLRQASTTGGKIEFNVANLPNGIYYLHIYDGVNEKPEMRQIVVQH